MFNPKTLMATLTATSSPVLGAGLKPLPSLVGRLLAPYGQAPVPASPSPSPVSTRARKTRGTSGRNSIASSTPDGPLSWWENRLRARMDVNGSPEYTLTWRRATTKAGLSISVLRASGRPTSATAFSGWATPTARDWKDSEHQATYTINPDGSRRSRLDTLPRQVFARMRGSHSSSSQDPAVLNPEFTRWLMGFPAAWGSCAPTVVPSSRKWVPSFCKRT